ncbi:MAG: pantoate--beta-alanine ligase [Planctomycetota bacterium]|nr:MAG: pantoate--beta-alanine ligase [Planctomycetota bacterium]
MATLLIESVEQMQDWAQRYQQSNLVVGLVPTMGFLHRGHLSLVEACLEECDITVVSIYVNPTQFAPHEDFDQYPRDLEGDRKKLEELGVDVIFAPPSDQMYPEGYCTYVVPERLSQNLCGKSRPTFFRGVCTVVLKLFSLTRCQYAYFGQKDYQQSRIIAQMVKDFHLPITIRTLPIVREEDGLAMSSRNAYLSPEQRPAALSLYQAIQKAKKMAQEGERVCAKIKAEIAKDIEKFRENTIDYIEFVHSQTLQPVEEVDEQTLVALAVFVGKTRLIDNGFLLKESEERDR